MKQNNLDAIKLQKNIKKIRQLMGWTNSYFAKLVGISRQHLSAIENEHIKLSSNTYVLWRLILDRMAYKSEKLRKFLVAIYDENKQLTIFDSDDGECEPEYWLDDVIHSRVSQRR